MLYVIVTSPLILFPLIFALLCLVLPFFVIVSHSILLMLSIMRQFLCHSDVVFPQIFFFTCTFCINVIIMDYHNFTSVICLQCQEHHYVPVYCGDRWCPTCTVGRRMRNREKMQFLIDNNPEKKGCTFKFLTLTIPSMNDLGSMVKRISSQFRKLRSSRFWKNHVVGGFMVIEVTCSSAGWHAHIHCLIYSLFLDWNVLRNLWFRISNGTGVHIMQCKSRKMVQYLTKYLNKPDVSPDQLLQCNAALKGSRMFRPFGTWHALDHTFIKQRAKCPDCKAVGSLTLSYEYLGGNIVERLPIPDS